MSLLCTSERLRIVVVGANDGKHNDPIYATVREFIGQRTQMILIEPQKRLHGYISEHYAFHDDVHILECAIGEGEADTLELHAVRPEYWARAQPEYAKNRNWPEYRAPTGITSTDRSKVLAWVTKHVKGLGDAEVAVESFEVPSRSLSAALSEAGLDASLDVLQIDAEGFDDVIIYNSDLVRTRPQIVYFESKTLSSDRFDQLNAYLEKIGYITFGVGGDTLAYRLNISKHPDSKF